MRDIYFPFFRLTILQCLHSSKALIRFSLVFNLVPVSTWWWQFCVWYSCNWQKKWLEVVLEMATYIINYFGKQSLDLWEKFFLWHTVSPTQNRVRVLTTTQRENMEIGIQLTPKCHHIWNWNKSIPWLKFWSNLLLHPYTMLQR